MSQVRSFLEQLHGLGSAVLGDVSLMLTKDGIRRRDVLHVCERVERLQEITDKLRAEAGLPERTKR